VPVKNPWLVVLGLGLACSGQLEYDVGAFEKSGQNTPPPKTWSDAMAPAASEAADAGAPPRMVAEPSRWDAAAEPQRWDAAPSGMSSTPPATSACEGMDALGILAARCGSCHGAKAAKGLDLVSTGVAARLVNVKSTCMGQPLLDGKAPGTTGHFIDKLRGPVQGCGAQMPYAAPALSQGELDCVIEWSERAIARTR
jgi:hypothetical protein